MGDFVPPALSAVWPERRILGEIRDLQGRMGSNGHGNDDQQPRVFSNRLLASAGPVFDQSYDDSVSVRPTTMTVQGTISKTALLAAILSATAIWSWGELPKGTLSSPFLIGALIGSAILGLLTSFMPRISPWTAPIYAAFEGLLLGAISKLVDLRFPGLAIQAVALSSGTLFCMLFAYKTGIVRVTDKLKAGVIAGTGAICLVYFASWMLQLFGMRMPYIHGSGPVGIIFSLVVVGLAALNLLLDFDFIEKASRMRLPKYMEWYGGFGLMVTMVWLYLEILNLLIKLQGRSSDD